MATASPQSATSPTPRPSRLRGLSSLRNYTHNTLQNLATSVSPSRERSNPFESLSRTTSRDATPQPDGPAGNVTSEPTSNRIATENNNNNNNTTAPSRGSAAANTVQVPENPSLARLRRTDSSAAAAAERNTMAVPLSTSNDGAPTSHIAENLAGLVHPSERPNLAPDQMPTIKFVPHQDSRSPKPSLAFASTSRTLPRGDSIIRVGRYSEKDGPVNPPANTPSAAPVGFKSKVVSRKHCEFWCTDGQWYIKDVKSSSGTFLNHIRLSQPSVESKPYPVNDGDVVQLGIDFRGGEEAIFRCVKIRIECNRSWQKGLNPFNKERYKQIKSWGQGPGAKTAGESTKATSNECSICLDGIAPCQPLFVAPCSHVWHWKCIRPVLTDAKTYPQFLCPNCRAVCDLEAELDDSLEGWENSDVLEPEKDGADDDKNNVPIITDINPVDLTREMTTEERNDAAEDFVALTSSMSMGEENSIDEMFERSPSAAIAQPRSIRNASGSQAQGQGQTTTESRTRAQTGLSEAALVEGILTPRNDAGPFVLDGGSS